jgi:hypothetical protein
MGESFIKDRHVCHESAIAQTGVDTVADNMLAPMLAQQVVHCRRAVMQEYALDYHSARN